MVSEGPLLWSVGDIGINLVQSDLNVQVAFPVILMDHTIHLIVFWWLDSCDGLPSPRYLRDNWQQGNKSDRQTGHNTSHQGLAFKCRSGIVLKCLLA